MWTQRQLTANLRDIGLPCGSVVLVHVAPVAVGPIAGGIETLLNAFRDVLGDGGTLLVPAFGVPAEDSFEAVVLRQPDVRRSEHPVFSFAAVGAEAEALTSHVPFHYPLGSEGPLARLHQRNGWILLIGVDQQQNTSLHLAEIWANMPYVHRSRTIPTDNGEGTTMAGNPECSAGFAKIELLLRQSRILRRGGIGSAESRLMRQQQTVSMAVAMLQGSPSALLCDAEGCLACAAARRMTAEQIVEPI